MVSDQAMQNIEACFWSSFLVHYWSVGTTSFFAVNQDMLWWHIGNSYALQSWKYPSSPDKINNMWCYNSLKINEYNSQKLWLKIAVALIYLHSRAASNHKLDHFMKKSTYSLLLAVPFLAGVFIPPMRAWNINNNNFWDFLSLTSLDLNLFILDKFVETSVA